MGQVWGNPMGIFPMTIKKLGPFAALLIAVFFFGIPSQVTAASVADVEIGQLLVYIERSGCTVYRNGTWHSASNARVHLEKKYRYLLDRGLVNTTEEFMDRAATASSISGEPYQVKCDGQEPVSSVEWLTMELQRLRKGSAAMRP